MSIIVTHFIPPYTQQHDTHTHPPIHTVTHYLNFRSLKPGLSAVGISIAPTFVNSVLWQQQLGRSWPTLGCCGKEEETCTNNTIVRNKYRPYSKREREICVRHLRHIKPSGYCINKYCCNFQNIKPMNYRFVYQNVLYVFVD